MPSITIYTLITLDPKKIHLLSNNSFLIQSHYYLNYPIASDGALTKVLLCESIRVGENVLHNNNFIFDPEIK
jgi:hypothetical protein